MLSSEIAWILIRCLSSKFATIVDHSTLLINASIAVEVIFPRFSRILAEAQPLIFTRKFFSHVCVTLYRRRMGGGGVGWSRCPLTCVVTCVALGTLNSATSITSPISLSMSNPLSMGEYENKRWETPWELAHLSPLFFRRVAYLLTLNRVESRRVTHGVVVVVVKDKRQKRSGNRVVGAKRGTKVYC